MDKMRLEALTPNEDARLQIKPREADDSAALKEAIKQTQDEIRKAFETGKKPLVKAKLAKIA